MYTDTVWTAQGRLLDASERATTIVTISGSGLDGPRTISATTGAPAGWAVSTTSLNRATAALTAVAAASTERLLWAVELPILLALAALLTAGAAYRTARRARRASATRPTARLTPTLPEGPDTAPDTNQHQRSNTYATH